MKKFSASSEHDLLRFVKYPPIGVIKFSECGINNYKRFSSHNIGTMKGVLKMEVLNLVLFGCVFYLALIGIPTLCEKRGK